MTRVQRIALLAGALVVAVAAFVILQPDDEDEPVREPSATSPAATTKGTAAAEAEREDRPPREPKPTEIRVEGGQPVGGEAKVHVQKGETIRLAVRSDVSDEVHVHGYDLSRPIAPGRPVQMRFRATLEGVFEVELEERAMPIAQLEVTP